jgi:hypothetical protein
MRLLKQVFACAMLLSMHQAHGQTLKDYVNQGEHLLNNGGNGNAGGSIGNLSNSDIVSGLKQALEIGTKNSANRLGAVNGFFGNSLIKIIMPSDAQNVERALREVGLGAEVDKAILSMNRAAEDAAPKAVNIFVNAITSMSIQDGVSILRGQKDAATQYLKSKTSAALTSAFRPIIKNSLDKVNATKYWATIINEYNRMPLVRKVNPDLTAYVTERALNGLFVTIAQEEANIRTNASARVTDLLQKVFGAH